MNIDVRPSCLAVIPARGGSQGIPRKNVLPVGGRPLIVHSIEAALGSTMVDRVVVSTDDAEIEEIAKRAGAETIRRPAEISGANAPSESALLHVLDTLEMGEGYTPDILVFLQCTAPLTASEDIDGSVRHLLNEKADSLVSVYPFHYFLWRYEKETPVGINHDYRCRPMRQEREPQYLENGAIYIMRTAGFRTSRYRFFGRVAMFEMPAERSFEIDEPSDLRVADALLRSREGESLAETLPKPVQALVMDFDGVMTDNRVWVGADGMEFVCCNRADGYGLSRVKKAGIPLLVISAETNPVVQARCRKLNIECKASVEDKFPVLEEWCRARDIALDHVVYVGNDKADISCLSAVGCGVTPADAYPSAKQAARFVLRSEGGNGVIREVCDAIMKVMGEKENNPT